jgi:hypothetical protein
LGTACDHDANCLFTAAKGTLLSYASPACSQTAESFSRGPKAPNEAAAYAGAFALFGGHITGNFVDILPLYFNSLWGSVSIDQIIGSKPIVKK